MKQAIKKKIKATAKQAIKTLSYELLDFYRTMVWTSYGGLSKYLSDPPDSLAYLRRKWKPKQISDTVRRLKNYGWLEEKKIADETYYRITQEGRIKQMIFRLRVNRKERGKQATIVIFDIPEGKRTYRNFLRRLLKQMKFTMIQRSVFITTFILPEEFYTLLKEMDIWQYVKVIEGEIRF